MPIPTTGLEKQINGPQVAHGKALNLTPEAKASAEMAADFGRSVARGVSGLAGAILQQKADRQNADDLLKANNAYNTYIEKLTDLNDVLKTKQGSDALNFEKDYINGANKLHDFVVDVMDNQIQNRKVSEDLRAKINNINVRNREESFLYFDKQKRDLENTSNQAAIDNMINQSVTEFQNNDGNNYSRLDNVFDQIKTKVEAFFKSQGMHPTTDNENINEGIRMMFNNKVTDEWKKSLEAIGEHLNSTNRDMGEWKETSSAIKMIEYARENGYIDDEWALKKLKEYENRALGVELLRHPELYWDQNTGAYNEKRVMQHTKYLSQDDIIRAGKTIKEGSTNNPSSAKFFAPYAIALNDRALEEQRVWRIQHGLIRGDELEEIRKREGKDVAEEKESQFQAAYAETSPYEIVERLVTMRNIQKTPVVYIPWLNKNFELTPQGKVKDPDKAGLSASDVAQIEESFSKGELVGTTYYPWGDGTEYDQEYRKYKNEAFMALLMKTMDKDDPKAVRRVGGWLLGSRKYNVESLAAANLFYAYNEIADYSAKTGGLLKVLDADSLQKSLDMAMRILRTGGTIRAAAEYANGYKVDKEGNAVLDENGNKQLTRHFDPINITNSFDNLDPKDKITVHAVLLEALRANLPAEQMQHLENSALMKEMQKALNKQNAGMRQSTGNMFLDDTNTYVEGYQPSYATKLGVVNATVMRTDAMLYNPKL